ncbi:hypothetical protein [Candidatus Wolbachia massiliensis]|uniref:hypothetical protein n=1 Tax=Candidatus Wolbachia massiliensis TaxID=1845000 RepID=UPI0037C0135B
MKRGLRKEKAILEQKLDDAKEEGILIGHKKGRHEGREEGIKIGEEKGKVEVAKNLLKAGISIDVISQTTGLPQAEILQLKEEIT